MKTLFKNAKIVTADEIIVGGALLCENGTITRIEKQDFSCVCDEIIDVKGEYLIPGFVDIHCHGGNNAEFMDATEEDIKKIADFHLLHGTTTLFATTLSAPWEETLCALDTFKTYFVSSTGSS